jgi:hypothetical protein
MKRLKLGCLALYLGLTVAVALALNQIGYEPFAWSAREIWLVCLGSAMGWVCRSLEERPEGGRVTE